MFPKTYNFPKNFIDAFGVKWSYDNKLNCWTKIGITDTTLVASDDYDGLLSAKYKQMVDSLPEYGGHFGIIVNPVFHYNDYNKDVIAKESIVQIDSDKNYIVVNNEYVDGNFSGKAIRFTSGNLKGKSFLILDNKETLIYYDGDFSSAGIKDTIEIVKIDDTTPYGIMSGNIVIKSESLNITCVDGNGNVLPANCNIDIIQCDSEDSTPPGLNFTLNEDFLSSFCVEIPGCQGDQGDQGKQGDKGDDGTGDGPKGYTGEVGDDASETPNTFSGIKINDVDDIYDTAVVGLELDGDNNTINVVKSKIGTQNNDKPANQVISTPLDRAIEFTDNNFGYKLLKPSNDPIGKEDVDIAYFLPDSPNLGNGVNVYSTKLSKYIDEVINIYDNKILEIDKNYKFQLKEFIENKDKEAREILGDLAKEVADCEFQIPLEFCIGLSSTIGCNPLSQQSNAGDDFDNPNVPIPPGSPPGTPGTPDNPGTPIPIPPIPGTPIDPELLSGPEDFAPDYYTQVKSNGDTTLPRGIYRFTYISGAIENSYNPPSLGSELRSRYEVAPKSGYLNGWIVGSNVSGFGLEFLTVSGGLSTENITSDDYVVSKFPDLGGGEALNFDDIQSLYQSSATQYKTVVIQLEEPSAILIRSVSHGNVVGSDSKIYLSCIYSEG